MAEKSFSDVSAEKLRCTVNSFNTNKVQYRDGKIVIMADISNFFTSALAICSIGGLGGGAAYMISTGFMLEGDEAMGRFLTGVALSTVGIYSTYKLARYLLGRMGKTPYLTLDAEGILEWGKRVLTWDSLYSIIHHSEFIEGVLVNKISLIVQKEGAYSTALNILDSSHNDFLPIQQGQFIDLIRQVADTQGVLVASSPVVDSRKGLTVWSVEK